jgi:hypothetical protein
MNSARARKPAKEIELREAALRSALDGIRVLAAQSRLLALNGAIEAAAARAEGSQTDAAERLEARAGYAAAEADTAAAAVELLLRQIRDGSAFTGQFR